MKHLTSLRKTTTRIGAGASAAFAALTLPLVVRAQAPGALTNLNAQFDRTGAAAGIKPAGSKGLPEIVGGYIQAAIGLLGIILVVLIIYAGFLWMTAQGNEEKIKKAKGIIANAVVGMVIIFAAYAITAWVIGQIASSTI